MKIKRENIYMFFLLFSNNMSRKSHFTSDSLLWKKNKASQNDARISFNIYQIDHKSLNNFYGANSPFCGAIHTFCFGLQLTLPMGFKARVTASSPGHPMGHVPQGESPFETVTVVGQQTEKHNCCRVCMGRELCKYCMRVNFNMLPFMKVSKMFVLL